LTAETAEIRPLIWAEPILRAGRPEMAPASKRGCFCCAALGMELKAIAGIAEIRMAREIEIDFI
jgi:hypothetical protein